MFSWMKFESQFWIQLLHANPRKSFWKLTEVSENVILLRLNWSNIFPQQDYYLCANCKQLVYMSIYVGESVIGILPYLQYVFIANFLIKHGLCQYLNKQKTNIKALNRILFTNLFQFKNLFTNKYVKLKRVGISSSTAQLIMEDLETISNKHKTCIQDNM